MNRGSDIGVGIVGLGRMGAVHATNLCGAIRGARLVGAAVDPEHLCVIQERGESRPYPVTDDVEALLDDANVEAVVVVSPSSVHHEHVALAAARGLPIFCEKPLADTVVKARIVADTVRSSRVPFQIGFQRRYDPGYVRAKEIVSEGRIGRVEFFRGVSCDHIPPVEYLRTSGGLFWDLGVHDFDAARFLVDDEIQAVHATGAIQVEPRLSEFDDVDYGVVVLRFARGALGVVQNSWRAPWGYEIRAEVYGSAGKVVTELDEKVPTRFYTPAGYTSERYHLFTERFFEAYRLEMQAFVDALRDGRQPTPDVNDGVRAIEIADTATRSRRTGQWVEIAARAAGRP